MQSYLELGLFWGGRGAGKDPKEVSIRRAGQLWDSTHGGCAALVLGGFKIQLEKSWLIWSSIGDRAAPVSLKSAGHLYRTKAQKRWRRAPPACEHSCCLLSACLKGC